MGPRLTGDADPMDRFDNSRADKIFATVGAVVQREKDDAAKIARLVEVLRAVNHTLCIHGHIDADTPLHERVHLAIAEAT